jgi:16S rRNA (uracil1498-N3)-methyltransferase
VSRRFYTPELRPTTAELILAGSEGRHLAVVLRGAPGDRVTLFNGRGLQAEGIVRRVDAQGVLIEITAQLPVTQPHRRQVTLATAVPKGDRFDWLVEKATELGVARLVPLKTARSIVEPRDTRLEKLRRVIVEASKQCGRDDLLELAPLTPLSAFLTQPFPEGSLWVVGSLCAAARSKVSREIKSGRSHLR